MNTFWHITGLFGLLSLSLACTGGGDSGADTPVAQGGGQDDYGVEIPVATSLTLADFGYSSSDGTLSDITSATDTTMTLTGESTELAYMAANTSTTGEYVIAILSPNNGESCSDFLAALASSTKTEAWLMEHRTYLLRSSFKAPKNGLVALRVDTTALTYPCSFFLVAEFLPESKGYQGYSGSVAFLTNQTQEDANGHTNSQTFLWQDWATNFIKKLVASCGSSDPMNPHPGCESYGKLSLSWVWDAVDHVYRFLIGQGSDRPVIEHVTASWGNDNSSYSTNLGKVNSTAGSSVDALAMRTSNVSVDRLAFMKNAQEPLTLHQYVEGTTWSERAEFDSNNAWGVGTTADGHISYIVDTGTAYIFKVLNLFHAADAGNISSALTATLTCYPSSANKMTSLPVSATKAYFLMWCGGALIFGMLDPAGLVTKIIDTGETLLDENALAIAATDNLSPIVVLTGNRATSAPDESNFAVYLAYFNDSLEPSLSPNSTHLHETTMWVDAGTPLTNHFLNQLRAILRPSGILQLVLSVNPGVTDMIKLYAATLFPNNTLNLAQIASADIGNQFRISNLAVNQGE